MQDLYGQPNCMFTPIVGCNVSLIVTMIIYGVDPIVWGREGVKVGKQP